MLTSVGQPSENGVQEALMGSGNEIGGANIVTDDGAAATTAQSKGGTKTVNSKRYKDVMDALLLPVSSYTLLHEPHLVPTPKKTPSKKARKSTVESVDKKQNPTPRKQVSAEEIKSKEQNPTSRKKVSAEEIKSKSSPTKKRDSFPSNVKNLAATGMLDGAGVKYLSASREKELRGIIQGSCYLCGCKTCNYSKAVSADEFEDHAGCKTSHPNNHIYLENASSHLTLHKIVQELKRTPKTMLCDAIHTLMAHSLNSQAFSSWKESFEAAASNKL